ncbi:MAG: S1 RNA-binding domain-containing protein [Chloroflexi bacterium]|nr:S1 RNA-binding domain-containing protein [Chloroflexota bacterium]
MNDRSDLGERDAVQPDTGSHEVSEPLASTPTKAVDLTPEVAQAPVASSDEASAAPSAVEETPSAAEAPQEAAQETPSAAEAAVEAAPAPLEMAGEDAPAAIDETIETAAAPIPAESPSGKIMRGQLIEGTISRTTPVEVFVDLGEGIEGVIPGRELDRMTRPMVENLKIGSQVMVYVVNPHDHQGNVLLSVNRAVEEMDWQEAEGFQKSQKVYEGHVAGYNKGGLIVRFGRLRGFVPQSQISDERRSLLSGDTPQEQWEKMVNEAIMVKVVEVDRSRNRLILSERAAARESREKRKETLVGELNVGDVRTGRVVSLEDFGAFVDIGGAEGLVHLTELSWKHVTHPREALRVGQQVRVEVISLDKKRNRIGLSIKRQEADPWDEVATTYSVGQLVQGTVTKLTKFGAFARLVDAPDIEGLVHISELSDERVTHPREVVQEGDKLTLRVVKIDVKNRRLGLSLKRVNSAEYLDMDWGKE